MKNKILLILIAIFTLCACMFTITACSLSELQHTHKYETLKSDSISHWYECECGEKSSQSVHNLIGGQCLCGYVIPHEHDYKISKFDNDNHWLECDCGEKTSPESHNGGTATCTNKAVCESCNQPYGELISHDYSAIATAPTCEEKGYTAYTCACGDMYKDNYVDALGHIEIIDEAVEPTCTETGLTQGVHCDVCKEVLTAQEVVPAKGHDYSAVVTAPTCGEKGYTTYACSCGDTYKDDYVVAFGHAWGNWFSNNNGTHSRVCAYDTNHIETFNCSGGNATCAEKAKCIVCLGYYGEFLPHTYESEVIAPTCEEKGYTAYTCTCGDMYKDNYVDALGHIEIIDEAVEPTCTQTGLTQGVHCDVCNEVLTAQEVVAAKGHDYTTVVTSPTCEEKGYTTYTCSCGDSKVDNYVDALGHTEVVDQAVEATCTETGLTAGSHCDVCNKVFTAQEVVPAKGHDYTAVVTAPTCEGKGFTTYTCECGDSYVADEIDALGHNYSAVATAPTCEEKGFTTYTCACGDSYIADQTNALGHTEVIDQAVEPTCTETGLTVGSHCEVCNEVLTAQEVVPAKGHEYTTVVTAPTCEEKGYTTYTCECGNSYVADEVDALGHSEIIDQAVEATCTQTGLTQGVHCDVCKEVLTAQEEVPAKGHDYTSVVTAPTCEEQGYTTYTCECGDTYVADQTNALGHEYSFVVTSPTCKEKGYTTYTCSCGDSYIDNYIDTLSHEYTAVVIQPTCEEEGFTTYTCSCGDTYTDNQTNALGHNYGEFTSNGNNTHSKVCVNDNSHVITEDCKGGVATEEQKAICEVCNAEYGALLTHTHKFIEQNIADKYLVSAADCSNEAVYCYSCRCGESGTETFKYGEPNGHNYTLVVVIAPTCEDKGYTTYTCSCGNAYIADYVDALGHNYSAIVTNPTCEDKGYTTYTCSCGNAYIADYVDALGHNYSAIVTNPTCKDKGYTTYKCSCGNAYIADYVDALGHNCSAVVTEPTCEEQGYTIYTCICGHSYIDNYVDALGHNYKNGTCTVCGLNFTEEKVLYSADDKALDLDTLKYALKDFDIEISSLDDIDGYIINGETVEELDLKVIINNNGTVNGDDDYVEAQSVSIVIGANTYEIEVCAYTKIIDEAQDLDYFRFDYANTGVVPHHNGYYVVTKDIDASSYAMANHTFASYNSYLSSADKTGGLEGVFDGQGHVISNLSVQSNGIFGWINEGATIKNIAFTNVTLLTGNYPTLLAHGLDSTVEKPTTLSDIYVEVNSMAAESGVLINNGSSIHATTYKNIVIEWTKFGDKELGWIMSSGGRFSTLVDLSESAGSGSYPTMFNNVYTITSSPVMAYRNATIITVAGNKVTLNEDGSYTALDANLQALIDANYIVLTDKMVANGIKSYDTYQDMAADTANDYSSFDSAYWTIINGAPRWKAIWGENHEHSYSSIVTNPTCTEKGYTTYTCACGDTYVDNYVSPCHNYDTNNDGVEDINDYHYDNNPNSNLCEDGIIVFKMCVVCSHTEVYEIIGKQDHIVDYWTVKVAPKADAEGILTGECKTCFKLLEKEIPAFNVEGAYTVDTTNLPVKCSEAGKIVYTLNEYVVDVDGNAFVFEVIFNSSAHTVGGELYNADKVYPLADLEGKKYIITETVVQTCAAEGYGIIYFCDLCDEPIDIKVKNECIVTEGTVGVVTAPDCINEKDGYVTYKCAVCGEDVVIAGEPWAHTFEYFYTVEDGVYTIVETCAVAGCDYEETYETTTFEVTDATCQKEGSIYFAYEKDGEVVLEKTILLEKLPHALLVNGKVENINKDKVYELVTLGGKNAEQLIITEGNLDLITCSSEVAVVVACANGCGKFDTINVSGDHVYDYDDVIVHGATCLANSYEEIFCTACAKYIAQPENNDKTGHSLVYGEPVYNAETGKYEIAVTCANAPNCEGGFVALIEAIKTEVTKVPTCLNEGVLTVWITETTTKDIKLAKTSHSLIVDGKLTPAQDVVYTIGRLDGTIVIITEGTIPTCESTVGYGIVAKCMVAGCPAYIDVNIKGDHTGTITDVAEGSTPATCLTNGVQVKHCSECDEIFTKVFYATGHNLVYSEPVYNPVKGRYEITISCVNTNCPGGFETLIETIKFEVVESTCKSEGVLLVWVTETTTKEILRPKKAHTVGGELYDADKVYPLADLIAKGCIVNVDYIITEAAVQTCAVKGYDIIYFCDLCDEPFYIRVKNECIVTEGAVGVVTAPDCINQKDGYTTYKCAVCGEDVVVAGEAWAHTFEYSYTVEDGVYTIVETCAVAGCDYEATYETTTFVETPATCKAEGFIYFAYEKDGVVLLEKTIVLAKTAHSIILDGVLTPVENVVYTIGSLEGTTLIITEGTIPTCESTVGYGVVAKCMVDGCYKYLDVKVKGDHTGTITDVAEGSYPATCITNGVQVKHCSDCDGTFTEVIPATGHEPELPIFTWEDEFGVLHESYRCKKCNQEITVS